MDRCSKCFCPDGKMEKHISYKRDVYLCEVCDHILNDEMLFLEELMKEDFGVFPINQTQKELIRGRMEKFKN